MKEEEILNCILDISEMQYKNTEDEWWKELADEVEQKIKRDKKVPRKLIEIIRRKNGAI